MATWHQQRRPVNHNHPTQWTVWSSPNEFAYSTVLAREKRLKIIYSLAEHQPRAAAHAYILNPTGKDKT
jgi:hypothetical protein